MGDADTAVDCCSPEERDERDELVRIAERWLLATDPVVESNCFRRLYTVAIRVRAERDKETDAMHRCIERIRELERERDQWHNGARHAELLLAQYRGERDALLALVRRILRAHEGHTLEISGSMAVEVLDEMRRLGG